MDAKAQFAHFHMTCRLTYFVLSSLSCFSKCAWVYKSGLSSGCCSVSTRVCGFCFKASSHFFNLIYLKMFVKEKKYFLFLDLFQIIRD